MIRGRHKSSTTPTGHGTLAVARPDIGVDVELVQVVHPDALWPTASEDEERSSGGGHGVERSRTWRVATTCKKIDQKLLILPETVNCQKSSGLILQCIEYLFF